MEPGAERLKRRKIQGLRGISPQIELNIFSGKVFSIQGDVKYIFGRKSVFVQKYSRQHAQ